MARDIDQENSEVRSLILSTLQAEGVYYEIPMDTFLFVLL